MAKYRQLKLTGLSEGVAPSSEGAAYFEQIRTIFKEHEDANRELVVERIKRAEIHDGDTGLAGV